MRASTKLFTIRLSCIVILLLSGCNGGKNANTWSVYKADPKSTSSSPLDQINKQNVKELTVSLDILPE